MNLGPTEPLYLFLSQCLINLFFFFSLLHVKSEGEREKQNLIDLSRTMAQSPNNSYNTFTILLRAFAYLK